MQSIETDVAVIGAGNAALVAALSALFLPVATDGRGTRARLARTFEPELDAAARIAAR